MGSYGQLSNARVEDVLYEEIPSPLLQHADAMYEGEDYDPRYYCQMTEV